MEQNAVDAINALTEQVSDLVTEVHKLNKMQAQALDLFEQYSEMLKDKGIL